MGGADWTGGWTAVAVAVQCAGRSQLAGGLCRDAAYAGSDVTSMQQENSKLSAIVSAYDHAGVVFEGVREFPPGSIVASATFCARSSTTRGYFSDLDVKRMA